MPKDEKSLEDPQEFTRRLKLQAVELGFPMVGVVSAMAPARLPHFWRWLDMGYAGSMQYLERRRQAYSHPEHVLEGCRSLLMLGAPYLANREQKRVDDSVRGFGKIARYAQSGHDYHAVIRARLKRLKRWMLAQAPTSKVRGIVDTAPVLERDFAEAAGLGWVGKNTLLLNKRWGSYFFLAALLTDHPLTPDPPQATSHCGTCTACLDSCPTQAFPEPFVLNASRCISYLTIEHSGSIDSQLADLSAGWSFGCDVCQEVCPWNRRSWIAEDLSWQPLPAMQQLDIIQTLRMSETEFAQRFRSTPLWRSGFTGMIRNAILVAGWQGYGEATELIIQRLVCEDEVLRASAAWALGRIGGEVARIALKAAAASESSPVVRQAITRALNHC